MARSKGRYVFHVGASYKFEPLTCPPVLEDDAGIPILPALGSYLSLCGTICLPASNSQPVQIFALNPLPSYLSGPKGQQSGGDR